MNMTDSASNTTHYASVLLVCSMPTETTLTKEVSIEQLLLTFSKISENSR